ncbi:hypothetical protein VPHD479_0246 [Vibrio phage D479]
MFSVTSSSKTVINGVVYKGNNISIQGDKVVVDGVVQTPGLSVGPINVVVEGDCGQLDCAAGDVVVKGNVTGDVETGSGDVECLNVGGSVRTGSGDVKAKNIAGSVRTGSGDINKRFL